MYTYSPNLCQKLPTKFNKNLPPKKYWFLALQIYAKRYPQKLTKI